MSGANKNGCGCGGDCGDCGGNSGGNFTYVRYATDNTGTNISDTRDSGNLSRCFQAIAVSNTALDPDSALFSNYFLGKWVDICKEDADDSCCCVKFAYPTPERPENPGDNSWIYKGGVLSSTSNNTAVQNSIRLLDSTVGQIYTIPNLIDNNSQPLGDLKSYFIEFDFDLDILPTEKVEISLGDGSQATVITISGSTGNYQGLVFTNGGNFSPNTILIKPISPDVSQRPYDIKIFNIRLGNEKCKPDNDQPEIFEGTWDELNELAEKDLLIVGNTYILTDYQTKYYIKGTMTGPIENERFNEQVVSGFGFFNPPIFDFQNGSPVTVVELPDGYVGPIQVGDTTIVTNYFSEFYFKFANGMHALLGSKFSYSIPRFKRQISFNDLTLTDDSNGGLPILKPNGIVNTEVHIGADYMAMKAAENRAVPIERISLRAISKDKFSLEAESITFLGDKLEYDFNDTEVLNDNDVEIGVRKGFIKRRTNDDVDLNKDWRVQRYRRLALSDENFNAYQLLSDNDGLYRQIGDAHACTTSILSFSDNAKYLIPFIENDAFYLDFTKNKPNPFKDGDTAAGFVYGGRLESSSQLRYMKDLDSDDPQNSKDLFILPLDNDLNPIELGSFVVKGSLENTVVELDNNALGVSAKINIFSAGNIFNSTFKTAPSISSNASEMRSVTSLDLFTLDNRGDINKLNILSYCQVETSGILDKVTIGGYKANERPWGVTFSSIMVDGNCRLNNCIFGGKRVDRLRFSNTFFNQSLLIGDGHQYNTFVDSIIYLTALIFNSSFYGNTIKLNNGVLSNPRKIAPNNYGFNLVTGSGLNQGNLIGNNASDLLNQVIDYNSQNNLSLNTFITAE